MHTASWRAGWAYSTKRVARDSNTPNLQEPKARAVIAWDKAARTPRFIKTRNGSQEFD